MFVVSIVKYVLVLHEFSFLCLIIELIIVVPVLYFIDRFALTVFFLVNCLLLSSHYTFLFLFRVLVLECFVFIKHFYRPDNFEQKVR